MSYEKYDDLYPKAQTRGKYRIFRFNIVGSRQIENSKINYI